MEKSEVMRMETDKLLTELFDLQRFERDPALQRVIDEVEDRWSDEELSDGELEMLSAAGDPYMQTVDPKKRDGPL